jgi:hypothetical protein
MRVLRNQQKRDTHVTHRGYVYQFTLNFGGSPVKFLLVLAGLAWATTFTSAAEPAALPAPAIEVRMKAIAELTGVIEYAGEILMQPEAGKQFAQIIKTLGAGEKGLEGIDPALPIGGYVRVSENIADSAIVVMVPLKDETAFLALLKDKLNVEPKLGDDGVYTVEVPKLPLGAIYFRVIEKYAYATIRNVKSIDKATVIAPKDFFKDPVKPIVAATVHWDRFPADVKKVLLGQVELQLVEATKDAGGSELQKQARRGLVDIGVDMVKSILTDGELLSVTIDADPKSDTLSTAVRLTAKPKTPLAANLASWADRTSLAASVAVAKNPMGSFGLIAKIPSGTREKLTKLIDVLFDDLLAGANEDAKPFATSLVEAIGPTLKSDDVQLGLLVAKLGKEKAIRLQAAVKTVKGSELENVLRGLAPLLMGGDASVKFDVEKLGERNLHEGRFTTAPFTDAFGTEMAWIVTSDDLLAVGIEDKPTELKAFLESKPSKLPMLSVELSAVKFGQFGNKNLSPEKYEELTQTVFGKVGSAGRDAVNLTITGGEELNLKFNFKGQAFKFFALIDQERKKQH